MPNNLTDTEIKKALECCILGDCQGCYYGDTDQRHCKDDLMQSALDLINRQEQLIKRLTSGKCVYLSDDEITEYCVEGPCPNYKTVDEIKAEAYNKFAYLLKNIPRTSVLKNEIDNILNELVGNT